MKEKIKKHGILDGKLHLILPYINIFLLMTIVFIIIYKLGWQTNTGLIQGIMLAGVVLVLIGFGIYSTAKGFTWKRALQITIAVGFIMRIGYMLYTPFTVRLYDLGDITPEGYGHAAYILKLMFYHHLPETNWVQFYHPPLFHFTAACVCSIVNGIMRWTDYQDILEIAKLVSCAASCWCLMLIPSLCRELKLSERATVIATILVAIHPDTFLIGARVNNDSLVIFFMMIAILYTIKWYKIQSWRNTIVLALAFGLGMMTKTSCGTIALFTGPVMLYVFIKKIMKKDWVPMFGKLCTFAAIAFPLGLWYTVRNYVLFKQPFGYVVDIGKDLDIYTGDETIFDRFIQFPIGKLLNPVYASSWHDCNMSLFVIKSSMFGEFTFKIADWIPQMLVFSNTCLIFLSLAAMIYMVIKFKENIILRFGMPLLWLVIFASFVYFNIQYPYGCTMDFRYIVPTLWLGAIFIATLYEYASKEKTVKSIAIRVITIGFIAMFSLFSILMFCFTRW